MNPRREYNRIYGGSYALACAESFLTKQGRTRPYVYWTALVMCAGALLALPIIHVDVTVQERGRVRPATERTAIVARTAGFISSIRVQDNDLVHAGDILLTLKTQGLQAKVDFNDSQRKVLNKELADLRYLLDCVGNKQSVLVNNLQTAQYISEYQKFDTDCRNANLKVDHTEREMNRNKQLLAIKVVAARDFEESSYQANAARVERETLNTIIHLRLRESLELLKRKLEEESFINYLGAGIFITGGCSLLNGIDHLAGDVFEMPARVAHAQTMSGLTSAFENPQFSTAIGLIKYAQAVQADRPRRGIGRIFGKFFSGMR